MKVYGKSYRTIWAENDAVKIIDQRKLPHHFDIIDLKTLDELCFAITDMAVRGAGLIGATAGYGMWLASLSISNNDVKFDALMQQYGEKLCGTRPTAANLAWAVKRVLNVMQTVENEEEKRALIFAEAEAIADEDADFCRRIGEHGLAVIKEISERKQGETVNILTHCNAGWLAFVDYGSALSPIYAAHEAGIKVHVWVDETRPRNQGASLTAWELASYGISHSVIADNTGGHLMQHNMVDMVITGADRVTRTGDAANKIGTYLKALAAKDNSIPMYIALPSSTFDFTLRDGVKEIPIELRNPAEVEYIYGKLANGTCEKVRLCPEESSGVNYAFDVTPHRLLTGLITERGICKASEEGILSLYPEQA